MKCLEVKEKIAAFLDDQLSSQEEQQLFAHLSSCSECSQYLDACRKTNKLLEDSIVYLDAPENFAENVYEEIFGTESESAKANDKEDVKDGYAAEDTNRASNAAIFLRKGVAAVAIAVLVIGGFTVSGYGDTVAGFIADKGVLKNIAFQDDNSDENFDSQQDGNNGDTNNVSTQGTGHGEEAIGEVDSGRDDSEGNKEENSSGEDNDDQNISGNMYEEVSISSFDNNEEISVASSTETIILTQLAVSDENDNIRPMWIDNSEIYYLSENKATGSDTYISWKISDGDSEREIIDSNRYGISLSKGGGVWSPDGKKIAFVTDRNGYWEIWCSDLEEESITNLSLLDKEQEISPEKGEAWAYNPVWSSKGELAFLTERFDNVDLMVMDQDGNTKVITKGPTVEKNPVWSPDGSSIAYFGSLKDEKDTRNKIYVSDRNGNSQKAVTPSVSDASMFPTWSPDGKKIAVNVNSSADKTGIWLTNVNDEKWTRISDIGGGEVISWSPDGKKIAFTDKKGKLYILQRMRSEEKTKLMPVTPGGNNSPVEYVEWSPDSEKLLFEWVNSSTQTTGIWSVEIHENSDVNGD